MLRSRSTCLILALLAGGCVPAIGGRQYLPLWLIVTVLAVVFLVPSLVLGVPLHRGPVNT